MVRQVAWRQGARELNMTEFHILGVVGAGAMGAGIAQVGLTSGLRVILFDLNAEALGRSGKDIEARLARMEEKRQLPRGGASGAMKCLTLATALTDLAPCDVVVEAIIERLEPKQKLFADLEKIVAERAILATNTSSLSVAAIAMKCQNKSRICGLHFFNPVPLMRLVEVIVAPATDKDIVEQASAFSKQIGKTPVTVKDGPGFLVNLQGRAYAGEALAIVQEGVANPAVVDRILRDGVGFRMGPFELMDLTGIDVNFAATTYIYQGYQHDPRLRTTTLHESMANAGRFGRKTGQGFFDYREVNQTPPLPSPHVPVGSPRIAATIADASEALHMLITKVGIQNGDGAILIAPIGEDCATACARLKLDPRKTVAIDLTAIERHHLTIMSAVGGSAVADAVADDFRDAGYIAERIQDSPGFVLQRVLAMVANLGCELSQIGVGTPHDIDLAMKLAQNYPKGPLEFGEWLGAARTHEILQQLQSISGSDRYRPSLWLRRRAQLGISLYEMP
jgi:3-hydroxybutyryl-CoA dehydrogenase